MRLILPFLIATLLLPSLSANGQATLSPPALAIDRLTRAAPAERFIEYLEDPDGKLTLTEVMAASFKPNPSAHDLALGYVNSTVWLRLRLNVGTDTGGPRDWRLEIAYPPLDRIDFYQPRTGIHLVGGDLVPLSARPYAHRNHVFPLTLVPGQEVIYLRVKTETSITVPVALWTVAAFEEHSANGNLLMGAYYGLLFALAAYNLMLFLSLRSAAYGYYVLCVLLLAMAIASLNGFGTQVFWPEAVRWNDLALPLFFTLAVAMSTTFAQSFLQTRQHFPRVHWLLSGLIAFYLFVACVTLIVPMRDALKLVSVLGLFGMIKLITVAVASVVRGVPSARYYLLAWLVLLLAGVLMALRTFGVLPNSFITQHGLQLGTALEMLLLSFALASRFNQMERARKSAEADTFVAQASALAAARLTEADLERRVAERTSALETANARLAASETKLHELAHHDALTGLPNRLQLEDHLERALMRARRAQVPVGLLVLDLDGFKPINDSFGHLVGDRLLVVVAKRLHDAIRESDLVARFGGDEFVVVLESPQTQETAGLVAAKLIEEVSQPIIIDGRRLTVGATVGVAVQTAPTQDAATLMRQADAAMYAAKDAGRGCWRASSAAIG